MRKNASLMMLRWCYGACVLAFVLNDIAFWWLSGTYQLYLVDYALRTGLLVPLFLVWRNLPPAPERKGSRITLVLLFFGLVGFSMMCEPISTVLGQGWQTYSWPYIENGLLWLLDVTLGIFLVAIVEELIDRRLALAVLPGPMWARVFVSSLLFGIGHWGLGYGHVVETSIIGLAFASVYAWTGSLKLVIAAHYAANFLIFGFGAGEL